MKQSRRNQERFKPVCARMPLELYNETQRLSDQLNISVSEVCRLAIKTLLRDESIEGQDKIQLR